jgi:hypothetical protein
MIEPVLDKRKYIIPLCGSPQLHEELAWYRTDDDRVLGVVIRDRFDNDFGWVVLTQAAGVERVMFGGPELPPEAYRAVDVAVSRPNVALATTELHEAMRHHCSHRGV